MNKINPHATLLGLIIYVTPRGWELYSLDLIQETDLLRKIPMFAKLDVSKLKLLAFTSEMVNYQDGDILFEIGNSADSAYVIMQGAVDVMVETDSGSVVASTLQRDQLFGEMALLNNAPRNATLKAQGDLLAMKISADMFLRLISENADMALDVMQQLSAKLAKSHELVTQLQRQLAGPT
ncbi:MAG: Crp/Fnr family transcriptional regulator [Gammaproteobacteria bacterium]|nr:Crp/Fnr family transcriptional regulator [Gammaproteobacteria bacterium]